MDDNKKAALKAALAQIDKQFGKGSVMYLGDDKAMDDIEAVSTGSLNLDIALGKTTPDPFPVMIPLKYRLLESSFPHPVLHQSGD